MIPMRVATPTIPRMVTIQDAVGGMEDMAAVAAVDVGMVIKVDMAVLPTLVVEQLLLEQDLNPAQGQTHMQANGDSDDNAQFPHDNLEQVDDYTGTYWDFIGYTCDYDGTSLLLDSCSMVNLITNKHSLLHGIHKAGTTMCICCTAGVTTTNLQGWLGDFPEPMWYIPQGVVNILSFFLVQQYYQICCNTSNYNTFLLTKPNGTGITFEPTGKGLYALTDPLSG